MTTLTESPALAQYAARLLAPAAVRGNAVACIAAGITPHRLRTDATAACPDLAPVWAAWAAEAEQLTARGMTARQAARVTARLQRDGAR